jgi:hypothetical protein
MNQGRLSLLSSSNFETLGRILMITFSERERCESNIDTFPSIFLSITLSLSHFLSHTHLNTPSLLIPSIIEFHRFI